jgi:hypothetical protein
MLTRLRALGYAPAESPSDAAASGNDGVLEVKRGLASLNLVVGPDGAVRLMEEPTGAPDYPKLATELHQQWPPREDRLKKLVGQMREKGGFATARLPEEQLRMLAEAEDGGFGVLVMMAMPFSERKLWWILDELRYDGSRGLIAWCRTTGREEVVSMYAIQSVEPARSDSM